MYNVPWHVFDLILTRHKSCVSYRNKLRGRMCSEKKNNRQPFVFKWCSHNMYDVETKTQVLFETETNNLTFRILYKTQQSYIIISLPSKRSDFPLSYNLFDLDSPQFRNKSPNDQRGIGVIIVIGHCLSPSTRANAPRWRRNARRMKGWKIASEFWIIQTH